MTSVTSQDGPDALDRASDASPQDAADASRSSAASILLRRSWVVVGGAVLVAIVVYVVSKAVPATYSSSTKVAVLVSGTDVADTSLGANNLASQYAQVVAATPVLTAADRMLHEGGGVPSSAISGGAVGAQNLIQIQATGGSAAVAQARAAAVTTAFIAYISSQVNTQAANYQKTSDAELAPLDAEIASTQAKLNAAGRSNSPKALSLESTLETLIADRASAMSGFAQTALAGRPTLSLVSAAGGGSQTAPRPTLYALVGLIIGLLVIARLVVYLGMRRKAA